MLDRDHEHSDTALSSELSHNEPQDGEIVHIGVGVAPGVAIGPVYVYAKDAFTVQERRLSDVEVEKEIQRFESAVARAEKDLTKIAAIAQEKIGQASADIFGAQALVLRDPAVYDAVIRRISGERHNADYAVHSVMSKHRQLLEARSGELMRERAQDLADVENRLIRHLQRGTVLSKIDPQTIVVAENLTAADIILFSRRNILGCAIDYGGPTSHVSIMARALRVPTVVSLRGLSSQLTSGDTIILDGFSGRAIVRPNQQTLEAYRDRQARYERMLQEQKEIIPLEPETKDGHRVSLRANLELQQELPLLEEFGAEGVGLFRTEHLFLVHGRFLTEEEQFEIYRRVVRTSHPHPVTFRMIDLGGDKVLPMSHREHNPFLGWRGIRILMNRDELLVPQLRAILRASALGASRILLPMVTTMQELRDFRARLDEAKEDLRKEGVPFAEDIPLGIMVEVPAVALMADQFAAAVEFMSIGTNDLTQYVLAVDRGNDLVSHLYQELHPAVLRLISNTIVAAHRQGIPVSVCGEMASDPRSVPILVGLGIDELSAAPPYLPEIKRIIRDITYREATLLARNALAQNDAPGVHKVLGEWFKEHQVGFAMLMNLDDQT